MHLGKRVRQRQWITRTNDAEWASTIFPPSSITFSGSLVRQPDSENYRETIITLALKKSDETSGSGEWLGLNSSLPLSLCSLKIKCDVKAGSRSAA